MKLKDIKPLNESVQKSQDNSYTSPDGKITITMDFDDPTEREAQVWFATTHPQEVLTIHNANSRWIDEVFNLYDVSAGDADVHGDEELEGGTAQYLEWPPADDDEGDEMDEAVITIDQIKQALQRGIKIMTYHERYPVLEVLVGDNGINIAIDYDEQTDGTDVSAAAQHAMGPAVKKVSGEWSDVNDGDAMDGIYVYYVDLARDLTPEEITDIKTTFKVK